MMIAYSVGKTDVFLISGGDIYASSSSSFIFILVSLAESSFMDVSSLFQASQIQYPSGL